MRIKTNGLGGVTSVTPGKDLVCRGSRTTLTSPRVSERNSAKVRNCFRCYLYLDRHTTLVFFFLIPVTVRASVYFVLPVILTFIAD